MSQPRISEEDLHAYLDGALTEDRRAEVERLLGTDVEAAQLVRAGEEQKALLHARFDGVLDEPVPVRLQRRRSGRAWFGRAAAGVALLLLGGVLGWWLRGDPMRVERATLARQAAIAHVVYTPEVRHPVEVTAKEEAHLVGWLSKRLGASVRAPKLSGQGFELLGGRLLPEPGRPGAQFMYQDAAGRRLTLYVSTDIANRDTAFRYSRENGVHVFYWIDGRLGYALSGDLEKTDMMRVARAVYEQLNP